MIKETDFCGIKGYCLENENIKVIILPMLGGKIGSFLYKKNKFEFAAKTHHNYINANKETPFEKGDASGIDDAFPNINAVEIEWKGRKLSYPDHGEIWRSAFDVKIEKDILILNYKSNDFGYFYEKKFSLTEEGILISYNITSNIALPCFWTLHGLVRYEEDMKLVYPSGNYKMLNVCESKELGKVGKLYDFANEKYDFEKVPKKDSNTFVKYYLDGSIEKGSCKYEYPRYGIGCEIIYDKTKLPYLGLWCTAGRFRGDYNLAFEPTNGFYDGIDIAIKNNKYFILDKNNPLNFNIEFKFYNLINEN